MSLFVLLFTTYTTKIGSFIFLGQPSVSTSRTNNDSKKMKTLLVKNVPTTADEDLLEMFFETTKKQGGGPVQSVKILRGKHVAFVEFCDRSSVEKVLKKRPIKLGTTVLDIEPYEPLLEGSEKINRMDIIGLPASFTDGLLKEHLETLLSPQGGTPTPSAEPKCETLTTNVGSHTPPAPTEKLTARTQRKSEKNTKNVGNFRLIPDHYCDEYGASHTPPAPTEKLTARTQRKSEKNTKNVGNIRLIPDHYCDEYGASHTPPAPTEKLTARTQRKSEKNTKNVGFFSINLDFD